MGNLATLVTLVKLMKAHLLLRRQSQEKTPILLRCERQDHKTTNLKIKYKRCTLQWYFLTQFSSVFHVSSQFYFTSLTEKGPSLKLHTTLVHTSLTYSFFQLLTSLCPICSHIFKTLNTINTTSVSCDHTINTIHVVFTKYSVN